jgi:hypothetical protein
VDLVTGGAGFLRGVPGAAPEGHWQGGAGLRRRAHRVPPSRRRFRPGRHAGLRGRAPSGARRGRRLSPRVRPGFLEAPRVREVADKLRWHRELPARFGGRGSRAFRAHLDNRAVLAVPSLPEEAPTDKPFGWYGRHKKACEELCWRYHWQHGLPLTMARLPTICGRGYYVRIDLLRAFD